MYLIRVRAKLCRSGPDLRMPGIDGWIDGRLVWVDWIGWRDCMYVCMYGWMDG